MAKRTTAVPIEPKSGGRLITRLSSERAGLLDYIVKRDWRRDLDQEIRREGEDYFYPLAGHALANQPFPQNQPTPPATSLPISLIWQACAPDGDTAIVAGTEEALYVFYPNAPHPYHEPGAVPDDEYFVVTDEAGDDVPEPGLYIPPVTYEDYENQGGGGDGGGGEEEPISPDDPCAGFGITSEALPQIDKGSDTDPGILVYGLAAEGGTEPYTWEITSKPDWAADGITIDPDGTITIVTGVAQAGVWPLTFTVTDANGCTDSVTINLVVTEEEPDPILPIGVVPDSPGPQWMLVGSDYVLSWNPEYGSFEQVMALVPGSIEASLTLFEKVLAHKLEQLQTPGPMSAGCEVLDVGPWFWMTEVQAGFSMFHKMNMDPSLTPYNGIGDVLLDFGGYGVVPACYVKVQCP